MKTTAVVLLALTGFWATSQTAVAQGYGATNRYGGGVGGERYGGGAGRTAPAPVGQPGRAGGGTTTGRGVAPAPLTRATAGQPGQMVRTPQAARVAAPVQTPPMAPAIPSDAVRFSDLPADSKFYFVADANRSFLWVKTSDMAASNTVNQKVASIPATAYVRAEAAIGERPPAGEKTAEQISVDATYEKRYGLPIRRTASPTNAPSAPPNPQ